MSEQRLAIGRVGTVLVFGQDDAARAVVSSVIARVCPCTGKGRLAFTGPSRVADSVSQHLHDTVLPVAHRVAQRLGLRRRSFEISVVNLGAAAVANLTLSVSGFSADAAFLLALLSAALRVPLSQDVVVTGHVASSQGDIRPVRGIPAKLRAAAGDGAVKRVVLPAVSADMSMQALSPAERERIEVAIINAKEHVQVVQAADVCQLIQNVFDDEGVLLGSLHSGFFDMEGAPDSDASPIDRAAQFLAEGNEKRFWRVLEGHLLCGRCCAAKKLLTMRVRHQLRRKRYPQGFGRRLLQLIQSLPPATRRLKVSSPLLPLDQCLELGRYAERKDHQDVRNLIDATSGKMAFEKKGRTDDEEQTAHASEDASAAVETVIQAISAETLAQEIGLPIDAARAAYTMDSVVVESHDVFHRMVPAFYLHLLRHLESAPLSTDDQEVATEALALLERAFRDRGGVDGAQAEARHGINGGMRFILDVMTEQYKTEQQAKRVSRVLKAALDPLGWDARVRFMAAFLERLAPHLPLEIRAQPPARFARHYEPILKTYVRSLDRVRQLLHNL